MEELIRNRENGENVTELLTSVSTVWKKPTLAGADKNKSGDVDLRF